MADDQPWQASRPMHTLGSLRNNLLNQLYGLFEDMLQGIELWVEIQEEA